MLFWHLLFFWQFAIYYCIFFLWEVSNGLVKALLVLIVVSYLANYFFDDSYQRGGKISPNFVNSFICQKAVNWFPFRYIKTKELPASEKYIFAVHPHGLMPWALLPFGKTLFPDIPIRSVAADAVFSIPVAREAAIAIGGISASRRSCRNALLQGNSLAILVGGSEEMLESEPNSTDEVLVINPRRGFIRLALEYGCHLVPCYCFGANELYHQITWGKSIRKWILKKTRFAIAFGIGKSFYNLFPKQRPLYLVVGKPIPVEKNPDYLEAEVEQLHAIYVQEVQNIYHQWKDKLQYERDLKIT